MRQRKSLRIPRFSRSVPATSRNCECVCVYFVVVSNIPYRILLLYCEVRTYVYHAIHVLSGDSCIPCLFLIPAFFLVAWLFVVSFRCSYGYFKIASTASTTPPEPIRPDILSFEKRTKWDAWKSAGETISIPNASDLNGSKEQFVKAAAKLRYTNVVRVAMGANKLESLSQRRS